MVVRLLPFLGLLLLFALSSITPRAVVVVVNAQSTAAGQETLIGIVGRDFVLLGADSSISQSISLTASMDKIAVLVNPYEEGAAVRQKREEEDAVSENEPSDNNDDGGSSGSSTSATSATSVVPLLRSAILQQQCIVAAAAGDAADADRLLSGLTAQAAIAEYESSIGCDVDVIDCTKYIQQQKEKRKKKKKRGESPPPSHPPRISLPAGLSVQDVAQLARTIIAQRMRKKPLSVCLLIGGMMPISTAAAAFVDGQKRRKPAAFVAEQVQWQVREASEQLLLSSTTSPDNDDEGRKEEGEKLESSSSKDQGDGSNNNNNNNLLVLEPRLYWLDEYGALRQVQYGAHGLASMFCSSILDKSYKPEMTRKQALALMRDCFSQLRTRYVVNNSIKPCIKCVDANGCRIILENENE